MEQQYRIISSQSSSGDAGRAIYGLLLGKEKSVRILIERRPNWEVGMTVALDETFVEANKEQD